MLALLIHTYFIYMRILSGPTYRYQGEVLTQPEIIVIQDHHYDSQQGYALQRLLDASVCPAAQHLLVFDHVLRQDEFNGYHHVCLPLLLAAECQEFNHQGIQPCWNKRHQAFNFMINKPRPHRLILMDMILRLALHDYRHSLCWHGGYREVAGTDYRFGDEVRMDRGLRNGRHTNAETYDQLLRSAVFEPTCVSLITEPAFYERETIITEKTLMAVWAGTLPIWVGGWRCADTMRDFGFDVFDDIVDHSYQSLPDARDRCEQAVIRNQELLCKVMDLGPILPRLKHNLDLVRRNVFLDRVGHILAQYPSLKPLVCQFRNGLLAGC